MSTKVRLVKHKEFLEIAALSQASWERLRTKGMPLPRPVKGLGRDRRYKSTDIEQWISTLDYSE